MLEAQQYLAKVIPWPENGDAYINIHWTFAPANLETGRKPPWTGRACRNLKEAVNAIQFALKGQDTRDIYVCLSTQRKAEEKVSARGFKYTVPVRNQDNAVALKSFYIDMDIKEGPTGYPSLPEAITALGNFIKTVGLPKPSMCVASGGGLHVYWTVATALTPEEWKPTAFALANALKTLGVKCDLGVTIDSARVLRIPDTWNRKLDQARPVKLAGRILDFDYALDRIAKPLEPYAVAVPQAQPAGPLFEQPGKLSTHIKKGTDELGAGIETAMPQAELRACLDAIPNTTVDWNRWNTIGMRVYAATEGADYGLAEWEHWSAPQTPADAKDSCKERWATFHHSPPTRTGAGALVNEVRAVTRDPAWTPKVVVTPQVTPAPPQLVATPNSDLPEKYTRDQDGIVSRLAHQEDGSTIEVPLTAYPMERPWLQEDPNVLHFMTQLRGRTKPISIETEIVMTQEMRRCLQQQGFMVPAGARGSENLGAFLLSWIEKLQKTTDAVRSAPFGWHVRNAKLQGFIYGGRLWSPTADTPAAAPDPVLARMYAPSGDKAPWIAAAKIVTDQKRPELEAILASAFAAPLVRFVGLPGALLSAYSIESGVGKTTTAKIAQAVWADPLKSMQSLTDTHNSVMGKLGQIRSLPLYWDELKTEEDTRKFVNITFQVTQGKEKSRMNRSAKQLEPGTWQTLLVSTSNDSLLDYVLGQTSMSTAGLYRIFEYSINMPPANAPGQISPADVNLAVAKIHDHYGIVGMEYAQFLGKNFVQVEADTAACLKQIEQEAKLDRDERFWAALISVLLMGARYAKQMGFADFDEPALKEFLFGVLSRMRQVKVEQPVDMKQKVNVEHMLEQFLNTAKARHTLFTNKIHKGAGKPPRNHYKVMKDTSRLEGIWVQVGLEDKTMRIRRGALVQWVTDKGNGKTIAVIDALKSELGARQINGKIGSGLYDAQLTGGQEYLLEIDLAAIGMTSFLED